MKIRGYISESYDWRDWENIPIIALKLSVRPRQCLLRAKIDSVGALVHKSEKELLELPNFAYRSLDQVKEKLAEHGLSLRADD